MCVCVYTPLIAPLWDFHLAVLTGLSKPYSAGNAEQAPHSTTNNEELYYSTPNREELYYSTPNHEELYYSTPNHEELYYSTPNSEELYYSMPKEMNAIKLTRNDAPEMPSQHSLNVEENLAYGVGKPGTVN